MAQAVGGKRSLVGKWKLIRNGSDYLPGLDNLNEGPLVLKLNGQSDIEFFKIEQKKFQDSVEEIQLAYVTKNYSDNHSYQLSVLNYENVHGNDILLGIIKNVSDDFTEFTVCRLGPKAGQNSVEHYQLNFGTGEVRVAIEITTADGSRINMIKYLNRFDERENTQLVHDFTLSKYTQGWRLYDIWPSTVLSCATVTITKAVKLKCSDSKQGCRVLDTLWTQPNSSATNIFDHFAITRTVGGSTDGEEVVMYIMQVSIGELEGDKKVWYIARRYREFDFLRKFLLSQNPFVQTFVQNDSKFPGKALSSYRKGLVEHRAVALSDFMQVYVKESKYCRQTSIDALVEFLQIPEHVYELARKKVTQSEEVPEDTRSVTSDIPLPRVAASARPFPTPTPIAPPAPAPAPRFYTTPSILPSTSPPAAPTPAPMAKAVSKATVPTSSGAVGSVAGGSDGASEASVYVGERKPAAVPHSGALTAAHVRLMNVMGERGLAVIKHGRQGAPKRRSLFLSPDGSQLIIQAEDHYKTVKLSGVTSIRMGSDVDPASAPAGDDGGGGPAPLRRRSSLRMVLGGGDGLLYGTPILRRSCDPKKMDMCLSLILPTRTVDIECLAVEDLRILRDCLMEICQLYNK